MKKPFLVLIFISSIIYFFSCSDNNPVGPTGNGKIFVSSIPPGAKIFLNGTATGTTTPDTIETNAGEQKISLSLKGYADTTFAVNVVKGETKVVNVTLVPLGNLKVVSDPLGAEIWLNGKNSGQVTPYTFIALTPGTYDVTFKLQNYRDTTLSVVVSFGSTASLNVNLTPISSVGKSIIPVDTIKQ